MAPQGYFGNKTSHIVDLPPTIKCDLCGKFKGKNAYSSGAIRAFQTRATRPLNSKGCKQTFVLCTSCTPGQKFEKECHWCDKTKAKDEFSKVQWRKDEPVCMTCVEKQNEDGLDASNSDEGESSSDSNPYQMDDDSDGVWSDSETTFSTKPAGTSSTYPSHSTIRGGGVALTESQGSSDTWAPTTTTASTTLSNTLNRNGYGNPANRTAPSTTSTSGGGKFAKLRAVPRSAGMRNIRPNRAGHDSDDGAVEESDSELD